jgi:integrase
MLEQKFRDYVRPKLGRYSLADLCEKRSIIGSLFDEYKEKYPNGRTIQIAFDELKRAFKFAQRKEWCNVNPLEYLERPAYEASEATIFNALQIHGLLKLAQGQDRIMLLTFLMTAVRPSELWGIKRKSLDLENGVLSLDTFVHTDEYGRKVEKASGRGKTYRSVRRLPLLPTLVQAFRFYLAGKTIGPEDYVFATEDGGLISDHNWRNHHFQPLVKAIGMEKATPYDLRHSANSFLAETGVPADIRAEICGHSEAVNVRYYTHFGLKAKLAALANLEALFAGAFEQTETTDGGQNGGQNGAETAA